MYTLSKNIIENRNNMGVDVYRLDALVSAIKFTPLIFINYTFEGNNYFCTIVPGKTSLKSSDVT